MKTSVFSVPLQLTIHHEDMEDTEQAGRTSTAAIIQSRLLDDPANSTVCYEPNDIEYHVVVVGPAARKITV